MGNLDPIYEAAARTLGAKPRDILIDVYLNGTLPEVFGGIRIALAGAWGLEAISELLGAPDGMGKVISALAADGRADDHGAACSCAGRGRRRVRCGAWPRSSGTLRAGDLR